MRFVFYDTETTGTKSGHDRIVEIAAYDPQNDRSFLSFVNPGIPIPKEASQIHHITDEMVAEAPSFADLIEPFIEFVSTDAILIAHNNDGFDQLFLQHEWRVAQKPFPAFCFLDSLKWARKYRPDLPRHTLQFLRESYGIETNRAHRALDDVIVLYKVFSCMIDDLPPATVKELLGAPSTITFMPFGKYQGKSLAEVPKDYVRWLESSGSLNKPENLSLKAAFDKLSLLSLPQ